MNLTPALVLDANILMRAVLGKRVRSLIETHAEQVRLFTPDACVSSAWTEDRDFFGIGIAGRPIVLSCISGDRYRVLRSGRQGERGM